MTRQDYMVGMVAKGSVCRLFYISYFFCSYWGVFKNSHLPTIPTMERRTK